ncbi:DinB family protein [Virgibacillus sp. Bac330]|uniref:DinB family protein n=1 Tax=Virgibacillus sp. Bac330 TaxID=2419841 RepID=UPI000EF4FF75|nr:DinB family protein [Virgibacillus sp. Bac330]
MESTKALVHAFAACNNWVSERTKGPEKDMFQAIAKGKWSTAEIISHMTFWDRYILEEMLPKMKQDATIQSVDFEIINTPASAYARSGVSAKHLIEQKMITREKLVFAVKQKTEAEFFANFTLNGEKMDQYSGYPHTLFNYIAVFIWHDNHHKQQIHSFLLHKAGGQIELS